MREALLPASNGMKTVSQAVEDVIAQSPFLSEIISEGLANNAQIARRIKPEVEKKLLEKVSESSIAMAIHRLSRNLQNPMFGMKFLQHMDNMTVRSNLAQFVVPNFDDLPSVLEKISQRAKHKKDIFLNFSRGLHESILIVSQILAEKVSATLKHSKNLKKITGLSAITMRLPERSLTIPGVYYPILKAIALEGISLVEVMSVRTEFSIIFEDKDIDRAFSIIKRITK